MKTCKAAPQKKEVIKKIKDLAGKYPIVGIINMQSLPAGSLLSMKKSFRGKVELIMTRRNLIERAIKELKLGDDFLKQVKGMPALLFTKENPFSLYKIIKKSKTPAAAKPGQISPRDITIQAGPTPFTPGPVISEFAQLGIKAGVEGGKVAVKQDKVVVKEGEAISAPLASMLARLSILPMEIGLDLVCVQEKGIIYAKSVLDIDETQFMKNLSLAIFGANNLAIETVYTTKDTIEQLLAKASRCAKSLGMEANILAPELTEEILAKAERIAKSVSEQIQH